ncbi:MAG: hypothetical protein J5654_08040 [Victivallales bacterium]|nr:hypothetical protein [Victivallales bacterium]
MKARFLLVFSVAAIFAGGCLYADNAVGKSSVFTRIEQGTVDDGCLRIGEKYVKLFETDFAKAADAAEFSAEWQPAANYEDKLSIELGEHAGMRGLRITRRDQPGTSADTLFSLVTKPFSVQPGGRYRLTIGVKSNLNLNMVYYRGWGESCPNCIEWQNTSGTVVDNTDLAYHAVRRDQVCENIFEGEIPAGASKAVVVLGADAPNVGPWDHVLFAQVRFEGTAAVKTMYPSCAAVSRALYVNHAESFAWEADLPAGAAIAFRLFRCADQNGEPDGNWEGPLEVPADGFATPWEKCWLRYEATLTASPDGATPTLKRVVCGDAVDANWRGADDAGPVIRQLSPVRTPDPKVPVEFEVADDSAIDWGSLQVTLDDDDITAQVTRAPGGRLVYAPDNGLAPLEGDAVKHGDANFHVLKVSIKDELGHEASGFGFVHVTERTAPNHVSLREDGAVLVNGKPFFPIGIYGVNKRDFNGNDFDNALRGLKEAGFNTAHTYLGNPYGGSKEMNDFLAAAERQGIMVFINAAATANDHTRNYANLLRQFSSPAILAWYIGDDTATYVNADDLRRWHELVRHVDPDHITVQADWISPNPEGYSNYYPFVHSTDGIHPEIYCIDEGKDEETLASRLIESMEDVHRDIERNGSPVKTVWPIVQYFSAGKWYRFPTFEELRVMSYEAIIHGANGITWWYYGGGYNGATHTPENWETIRHVATELHALSEVFLESERLPFEATITEGPQNDKLDYPSISVLAKRHDGKLYLVCANSAKAEVEMEIPCPGMANARVWFEEREVALSDGVLRDHFAPFGVHVYELE